MYEAEFETVKRRVMDRLRTLPPSLSYHSPEHTLDVLEQCERIAQAEGLTNERQLFLLRLAALYHDTGYLHQYSQHEEESCRIFLSDATHLSLSEEDKNDIIHLIMATKVPQQPATLPERILCDADLDYLGREDFSPVGDKLRREFLHYGIIGSNDEWHQRQVQFLTTHQYHTASSRKLREPVKQKNLRSCRKGRIHRRKV
jgi:uncharacterized protein